MVSNIITTVMAYVPTSSPVYHGLLIIPNVTLTSMMACRVYRNTMLGLTRGGGGDELSLPTLGSGPGMPASAPRREKKRPCVDPW